MILLGIDEAGKGPVIGPMVICGYSIDSKNEYKLKELGVKDSKLITPKKRESMENELKKICKDYFLIKLTAKQIDDMRLENSLNKIEIFHIQKIIQKINHNTVIIDAIESNTEKFKDKVLAGLNKKTNVISENKADKNHLVVGAASILAKVERDREIKKLHKKYGDFGSGYPSDPRTINFLKDYLDKNNRLPSCVRESWMTAQNLLSDKQQRSLSDFR